MVDLKRSIVIVSKYTIKSAKTGRGSRGSTPGQYVTRYMARELATETVTPITARPVENFTIRYMARESAVERAGSAVEAKNGMRRAQGLGGVAFGYGQSSLSDQGIRAGGADIQRLFDSYHTVMNTVVSFDHEYLRERGIIAPDFEISGRGDYRGNIDHMKLRTAVMAGLDRMNRSCYDDLRYVGVIQVDTEHVHCHLSMVDAGEGRRVLDGTQRGKIDARAKSLFRRGVDAHLDEKQHVKFLSSAVGFERRNVTTYIKRWAHRQIAKESLPQFLIACLPADRRLWRAGTNDVRMRKPNAIVTGMVTEMLEQPGSPMGAAMATVLDYAGKRRADEQLDDRAWRRLVENGRAEIVSGCVNGVYSMLRALPEDALRVRTPMLEAMSMDYEEMARRSAKSRAGDQEPDPMMDFGFKLRSYAKRLEEHTSSRQQFHELVNQWDVANEQGVADPASVVMRRLYEEEEEYHAMCMAKYRHFLPFTVAVPDLARRWNQIADYGEAMLGLEMMLKDESLRKLKDPQEARSRAQAVYGQPGGELLVEGEAGRAVLSGRAQRARATYERQVAALQVDLAARGLVIRVDPLDADVAMVSGPGASRRPAMSTETGNEYPFEEVKSLDMHHMRFDFVADMAVGPDSARRFIECAGRRDEALSAAVEYLQGSGQPQAVSDLPVADIEAMQQLAQQLAAQPAGAKVLPSRIAELATAEDLELGRRSATVLLDEGTSQELDLVLASQSRDIVARIVPASYRTPGETEMQLENEERSGLE